MVTCKNCFVFAYGGNVNPGDVPVALQGLSFIEKRVMSRIHIVMSIFQFKHGQYGYKGHIVNSPQDVQEVATNLPCKIADLKGVVCDCAKGTAGYKDFDIHRQKVLDALVCLKEINPFYKHIVIDYGNLECLPECGNVFDELDCQEGSDDDETNVKVQVLDVPDQSPYSKDDQSITLLPPPWSIVVAVAAERGSSEGSGAAPSGPEPRPPEEPGKSRHKPPLPCAVPIARERAGQPGQGSVRRQGWLGRQGRSVPMPCR